ncbi:MAG: hypothetical protein AB1589_18295 [Cyanobacteriota bacterium]
MHNLEIEPSFGVSNLPQLVNLSYTLLQKLHYQYTQQLLQKCFAIAYGLYRCNSNPFLPCSPSKY